MLMLYRVDQNSEDCRGMYSREVLVFLYDGCYQILGTRMRRASQVENNVRWAVIAPPYVLPQDLMSNQLLGITVHLGDIDEFM